MREKLLEKIELLRQQMVKVGLESGLNHPDVLEYSRKIDQLHNALLEMERQSNKKPYRLFVFESQANFA